MKDPQCDHLKCYQSLIYVIKCCGFKLQLQSHETINLKVMTSCRIKNVEAKFWTRNCRLTVFEEYHHLCSCTLRPRTRDGTPLGCKKYANFGYCSFFDTGGPRYSQTF